MGKCCVSDCGVYSSTSRNTPKFQHVHPNARGKMLKITPARRKMWKNLLLLEDVAASDSLICCRHFSMPQFNEIRLSRGCSFNILQPEAMPDIFLPGKENPPDVLFYQELEPKENEVEAQDGQFPEECKAPISSEPEPTVKNEGAEMDCSGEQCGSNETDEPCLLPFEFCDIKPELGVIEDKSVLANDHSANILLSHIGLQKSKSYDLLCKRIYKNQQIPPYAEKSEFFYARNLCEVVSRRFLKDAVSAFTRNESELNNLKKVQQELIKSREIIRKQKEKLDKAAMEKETTMAALRKRFSQAQLDRIMDEKNSNWSHEDYQKATTLLVISDEAYKVTRELLKVPLPARSAVKNLLANANSVMSEGILE